MDLRRHWQELFRHDQWCVGIVDAPIAAFLDPQFQPRVRWLPHPGRGGFYADPFGHVTERGLTIYCELWQARAGRGHLVALDAAGSGPQPLLGMPAEVHLSYPYLIEEEGELYCVPEAWESGEIALFRRTPAERPHWDFVATLVPDFAGVDPTIFRHGGQWWLAATNQATDPHANLHLWHAPALRGPWTPHAANPVKRDPGSSRPAGTPFAAGGSLYRPAQDCSATYGGAVVIQRVTRLTPSEFAEQTVARIAPRPEWRWSHGLHTLAGVGNITLMDAKRVTFLPPAFRRVLRRKLHAWAATPP
ncbi:MAG: glucosamine inositolphosphorylceramide transferase family protein [Terriglobales bacterium]